MNKFIQYYNIYVLGEFFLVAMDSQQPQAGPSSRLDAAEVEERCVRRKRKTAEKTRMRFPCKLTLYVEYFSKILYPKLNLPIVCSTGCLYYPKCYHQLHSEIQLQIYEKQKNLKSTSFH